MNTSGRCAGLTRRPSSVISLSWLLLWFTAAGCGWDTEQSDGVKLLMNTQDLGPGSTFELRFDEPMVRSSRVGIDALQSPLVFKPSVAGRFVYTSSRSGVFTPEEPLSLGVKYRLSLLPGLQRADGQPARARLRKYLATPPFGILECLGPAASTNALSRPEFQLWFNADVKAEEVALHAGFVNAKGLAIPAEAQQGVEEDRYRYWFSHGVTTTWQERFQAPRAEPALPPPPALGGGSLSSTQDIPNLVLLTPKQPLSVGAGWKLVIRPRLASADGRLYLTQAFEQPIGEVLPFIAEDASMQHVIHQAPRLDLYFSKALDPALTNSYTNWMQIVPWPPGLKAEVEGSTLSLSGAWRRGTNYSVTVRRGLPSAERFFLEEPKTFKVDVPPVDPRLYFAAFSSEQMAEGRRCFPLLAVNVSRIRVHAKLLEWPTAIHALRGYTSYLRAPGGFYWWGGGYRRVDYNLIAGRTLFAGEIAGSREEDVAQEIKLQWDQLLQGRRTGIVFVEAERVSEEFSDRAELGTQALMQVTDLGLVWKSSGPHVEVFIFSYDTGQPVAGARVRLCSDENDLLRETTSDASGLARLEHHPQAKWLLVQAGEDVHAVRLQEQNISTWSLGIPARSEWGEDDDTRRVALFTDRDVYRPSETVHLKAVVRDLTEAGLRIPAAITSVVTCADVQGKDFFTTNLVLSDLGSCATSIPLPPGPRGSYAVKLEVGGRTHKHGFLVADYQPAAFEIVLQSKRAYGPGEIPKVLVGARYLFGSSLHRARVHWSLEAEDQPFQPRGFDAFTFGRAAAEAQWGCGSGTFATSGQTQINSGSNSVITAEVPLNPLAPQPRAVSLLVDVTDLNQQTLTRATEFVQHSSDFYLGLQLVPEVLETGRELPIEIVAVGANQKPWLETVPARLTLRRVDWQTVRVQGAGRTPRYRSEAVLTNLLEKEVAVSAPVKRRDGEEGWNGSCVEGIRVPEAGEYLVEVRARDAQGRDVVSSIKFTVTENEQPLAWNYLNEVQVQLLPDRPRYQPGETALILVKTPISGAAWVTVERDRVLRSFVTQLEGNAPAVRVPIEATDVPNVFLSVSVVRGARSSPHKAREPEYRVGYCQINVEDPDTRLRVEVTPHPTPYRPGDVVTAEARIANAAGQPVSEAEVTFYAVDEGILSLTGYAAPDLHAVMFAPHKLAVRSAISLPFLLSENPEQLTFQNKGYLGGGGGNEKLRKHFLACAFWNASARSGPDGRVVAQFRAPDSLTRYRMIAVAQTAASQFGSGSASFAISKPLMIEPALPSFARLTDRLQARAVVLNQTDQAGDVQVSLELDDTAKASQPGGLVQVIPIAARGSAVVDVPVVFDETGLAHWNWRVRFAGHPATLFGDAVRSTLQVVPLMPLLREVAVLQALSGTNLLGGFNPQLLSGEGTVTVTVANTSVVCLAEAIEQLLQYPYGCAEQTGSGLLPWTLLQETPELLPFTGRCPDETAAVVSAGVQRLVSMQTPSGGLAYWPGEPEAMLWASAYGGFVLTRIRAAGLPVPEEQFKSLLDYLSARLRDPLPAAHDLGDRCLALYTLALAGRAEPAYHESLFERRGLLSAEHRAWLALAIAASGGRGPMTDELLKTNSLPTGPELAPDVFSSPAREKALRLLALLACRPNDPEVHRLSKQLQGEQKQSHWITTQGNAWALLALRQSFGAAQTHPEPASATLTWGSQSVAFRLGSTPEVFRHTFRLHPTADHEPLRLLSESKRPFFAQVKVESRSTLTRHERVDRGLSLQRRYARLNDANEPQNFDTLRVGDRVLVTLRLTVHEPARYVAVDDPLPSVFEAVHPDFKTQQIRSSQPPAWMSEDDGDFWWSDFREIRSDRVLFFANTVTPGSYVIRYVARVRAAGTVTSPPAKAEEMYRPDRFGLTETQVITSHSSE